REPDGAHEPAAARGARDRVPRAVARRARDQFAAGEGDLAARRRHRRAGPAAGRGASARAAREEVRHHMLAERMGRVSASPTLKVLVEADKLRQQGIDVVEFGAGEPDFPTPDHVKAAAHAAIDTNFTKYTPAAGTAELKKAIGARYKQDYGIDYGPSEVIVTAGGKQALYNVAVALFGAGDEVITHAPCWPTLLEQVKLADATPIVVNTRAEDGFA